MISPERLDALQTDWVRLLERYKVTPAEAYPAVLAGLIRHAGIVEVGLGFFFGAFTLPLAFVHSLARLSLVIAVLAILPVFAIAIPFERHMLVGAGLCTLSAIFDCADGQLARMRKTSSSFGRMLDGASDSVVMAAIFLGTLIHFAHMKSVANWTPAVIT